MKDENDSIQTEILAEDSSEKKSRQPFLCLHPLGASKFGSPIFVYTNTFTLGRKNTNSFQIMDKRLSGTHCRIERHLVTGMVMLMDLSSNGTYINMKEIGKGKKVALQTGDHIHLLLESDAIKKSEEIGYRVELLDVKMKHD